MSADVPRSLKRSGPTFSNIIIYVGQDSAGHWLVQDNGQRMEGRFVSYAAAMSFAQAERDIYHGVVATVAGPMVPLIAIEPARPLDRAA